MSAAPARELRHSLRPSKAMFPLSDFGLSRSWRSVHGLAPSRRPTVATGHSGASPGLSFPDELFTFDFGDPRIPMGVAPSV